MNCLPKWAEERYVQKLMDKQIMIKQILTEWAMEINVPTDKKWINKT